MFLMLLNNLAEASRPPPLTLFSLEILVTIHIDYIDLSRCPLTTKAQSLFRAELSHIGSGIFPRFRRRSG